MKSWRLLKVIGFRNAFRGIYFNLRNETNFLIQLVFAVLAISAGFIFSIEPGKWAAIILVIGAVLSAEAINTAVEKLCDRFLEEDDLTVKIIKDSAAAAVLILSITAVVIGILVFWPYLESFLSDT